MVRSHATGLGTAKLGEYSSNAYIVYLCRVEVWELGDGRFEDL